MGEFSKRPKYIHDQLISEYVCEFQCNSTGIRGGTNTLDWEFAYSKLGLQLSHSKLSKYYPFTKRLAGESKFSLNRKTNVTQLFNWGAGYSERLDSADGAMTHTEQRLIGIIEDFA